MAAPKRNTRSSDKGPTPVPLRADAPHDGGLVVEDLTPFCVGPDMSLKDVIAMIDHGAQGLALVVDGDRRLLGTVTDGDIRRAILAGIALDVPAANLIKGAAGLPRRAPVTAPTGTDVVRLLVLMSEHGVRHIPLLDDTGRVAALALLTRLVRSRELPMHAVIMAGGLGTRLMPLTETTPKPMLPVGDRPLLERTLGRLGEAGIRHVNITTHYLAERIEDEIGSGAPFGVAVSYTRETEPLGTAGALRGLDGGDGGPLLVINGDVLTSVNFRAMLEFHREHQAEITLGVRPYAVTVPFGVIDADGPLVRGLREKPTLTYFVNAGIYLVDPAACRLIPSGRRFDMTDLVAALLAEGRRVVSFPIHEYWLDIGRHDDYARAQKDVAGGAFG